MSFANRGRWPNDHGWARPLSARENQKYESGKTGAEEINP